MDVVETFTGPAGAGDSPPPPPASAFDVVLFAHAVSFRSIADASPTHFARALGVGVHRWFPFRERMDVVGPVCVVYGQAPALDGGMQGR